MAVTYVTDSAYFGGGGGTQLITVPSNLQVGDVIVMLLASTNGNACLSTPDGFEYLHEGSSGAKNWKVYWKVATQADVDDDFFNQNGTGVQGHFVFAIRDCLRSAPTYAQNAVDTSLSVTTTGVTPTANSMLAIVGYMFDTGTGLTQSTYSIATSNPTWTEQHDQFEASIDQGAALATAVRSQATGTGNSSVTASEEVNTYVQYLFAFAPYGGTDYTFDVTTTSFAITANTVDLFQFTPDIGPNESRTTSTLTNTSRQSSSFTNTDRQSSSMTNSSKPS